MKKNNVLYYLALGIMFLLFNLAAFLVPSEKSESFWVAYAFSAFAFISQIPLWIISFNKKATLNSNFLSLSVFNIGVIYLAVQLIAFAIFMIFPSIPVWVAALVCSIILVAAILVLVAGYMGINEVSRVETKVKLKRFFIQSLQVDIEMLVESESDESIRSELKKLAERVRFSDPMSSELLAELESRISAKVEKMKVSESKAELIKEVDLLLTERNKKCKIMK